MVVAALDAAALVACATAVVAVQLLLWGFLLLLSACATATFVARPAIVVCAAIAATMAGHGFVTAVVAPATAATALHFPNKFLLKINVPPLQ